MLGFCEICMQLTLSVLPLPMLEQNAVKEKIRCWPVKWKTCYKMSVLPLNPTLFSPSLCHLWQDQGSLGEMPWTYITWRKFSRKVRLWEFLLLKDTLYGTRGKKGPRLSWSLEVAKCPVILFPLSCKTIPQVQVSRDPWDPNSSPCRFSRPSRFVLTVGLTPLSSSCCESGYY